MKSLSEIETTSKRASRAVGFSWGIAEEIAKLLTEKQKSDEDTPQRVRTSEIIFGCTGTIGETYP